ncbi:MAG: hypothetical protein JRG76_03275 [Deltaproteobacteria bacterium]|nr:hypothetical protein [Deltaproteobacteria bacterium]
MRPALPEELIADPFAFVRATCARVAQEARWVEIDSARLEAWTDAIPGEDLALAAPLRLPRAARSIESRCAFVLQLDAVNFGSGWFPSLLKRPGLSGYRTIEAALVDRFERGAFPSAEELARSTPGDCAALFGQAPDGEAAALMALFAEAWTDLGRLVRDRFGGRFAGPVEAAGGSPDELVRTLLELPFYRDLAQHRGRPVAFLKRAQITVADLAGAGAGGFRDLDRLTLFADNLVPHVLRLDGVLRFDPDLVARIERGELLEAGGAEEIEIRACAVHAVELAAGRLGPSVATPARLDAWLWLRGGGAAYKAHPRHRTRCVYY